MIGKDMLSRTNLTAAKHQERVVMPGSGNMPERKTGPAGTRADQPRYRRWLLRLLPLVLIAGAGALIVSQGWHHYLSFERLALNQRALDDFIAANLALALAAYIAIYISAVTLSLPGGVVLTVSGGLLFGAALGGALSVIAASIGATLIFLVARSSLGEPLAERAGPWLERFRTGFQENALSYMLFLRLVPVFPFWVVNLAPALLGVRLRDFVLGTAIGIIPGTFAFAFAGQGLGSVFQAQRALMDACEAARQPGDAPCRFAIDPGALITPELLLGFAALGVVALIPILVKKLRKSSRDRA
jgi:uncharacterized membrane protein YdjX (TVP38/TMEM64 family)